ncbi:MAG: type 4a pilus biogenesis protein PilO [gamma proteobacterium symbiont of Bathyaustriella thionipta]|nr:type 4a pilus biogenesis protein PilO [gamma proteobacterium symbiont of Bathyaustriella thionipta]
MTLDDLNELDFSNLGDWPILAKAGIIVLLAILVLGAWFYFVTQDQLVALDRAEAKELEQKKVFEDRQRQSANLVAYKEQLAEMQESFGAMLRQLPNKTEVAELLVDVSQTGLAAGLEFKLFRPTGEVPLEFYAEFPIKLQVVGTYHELAQFVSGLAALPRIVTIHDVSLSSVGGKASTSGEIQMQAIAKTYRYLDEEG